MRNTWIVGLVGLATSCAANSPSPSAGAAGSDGCERGSISYYSPKLHGRLTASGAAYDHQAMTAAHRSLRFGTRVRVTVGEQEAELVINDRGPFAKSRILDVSGAAAEQLGLVQRGHAEARVCVVLDE